MATFVGLAVELEALAMLREVDNGMEAITQDVSTLASELRNLAEYYIQAARRSFSFAGEFRYQFKNGPRDKAWRTVVRKRDPRVFSAYQSMVQLEPEKAPNVARRAALVAWCFWR